MNPAATTREYVGYSSNFWGRANKLGRRLGRSTHSQAGTGVLIITQEGVPIPCVTVICVPEIPFLWIRCSERSVPTDKSQALIRGTWNIPWYIFSSFMSRSEAGNWMDPCEELFVIMFLLAQTCSINPEHNQMPPWACHLYTKNKIKSQSPSNAPCLLRWNLEVRDFTRTVNSSHQWNRNAHSVGFHISMPGAWWGREWSASCSDKWEADHCGLH